MLCFQANWGIFGAYAEAPGASAEAAVGTGTALGANMRANAHAGRVGVKAGPLKAELNPNLDIGTSIGPGSVSANLLGVGFTVGPECSIKTPLGAIKFGF